jgi:hypothetical protein
MKKILGSLALLLVVGFLCFPSARGDQPKAARYLGKVLGTATDFSDHGTIDCCPKIRYTTTAYTSLVKACEEEGGSYVQNLKFVTGAYCYSKPCTNCGYKYQCFKLVEAECYGRTQ